MNSPSTLTLQGVGGSGFLSKLVGLSLVESATTHATREQEYRVTTILEPFLQAVLTGEEWQTTLKAATQSIYKSWWEEVDNRNEEQGREIVRLAVLAESKEIAVTVGDTMANHWVNSGRYVEALELCREILQLGESSRILGTIATAETTLGLVGEALTHYQQALELCPKDDLSEKGSTLHNMAGLKAQQGEIENAIALYNQSLEIFDSINNVRGKAATLHAMAGLKAQQGEIENAIALYNQSLEIFDSINNVGGKAVTLANIAYWEGERGNKTKQLELYLQVAQIFGQIRAYLDLRQVLKNLGVTDEATGIIYLAQAVWLCLRVQIPLADTINTVQAMYNRVPQGDELEALLGAVAVFRCQTSGGTGGYEELQQRSFEILAGAVASLGIKTQEAFDTWYVQLSLNDPDYFIPRLVQRLEEIVGDKWLFERF